MIDCKRFHQWPPPIAAVTYLAYWPQEYIRSLDMTNAYGRDAYHSRIFLNAVNFLQKAVFFFAVSVVVNLKTTLLLYESFEL